MIASKQLNNLQKRFKMRNKRKLERRIDDSLIDFKEGEQSDFPLLVRKYIQKYGTTELIEEQVREYEYELRRRGNE